MVGLLRHGTSPAGGSLFDLYRELDARPIRLMIVPTWTSIARKTWSSLSGRAPTWRSRSAC